MSGLPYAPKSFTAFLSCKGHRGIRLSLELGAKSRTDGLVQHLQFADEETETWRGPERCLKLRSHTHQNGMWSPGHQASVPPAVTLCVMGPVGNW